MYRTFDEVKKMLEDKKLLVSSMQHGEKYDMYDFRTMRYESEWVNKILVIRQGTEVWEDSASYIAQYGALSHEQGQRLIARSYSSLPFQLFVVTDIDAAEKALKEFFS